MDSEKIIPYIMAFLTILEKKISQEMDSTDIL